MRIAYLEARAFGAIAGRELDLPDGLVVLHGPNESGKSSTVDLIRGVLFGFPPLRRDRGLSLREPRDGGPREGRVDVIAADDRRLMIERRHGSRAVISAADGDVVGEPALRSALGGADENLFLRVQTFSADDLAPLGLLDEPGVREQILAAAVMGGGPGAGDLLRILDERSRALYLRGGENQRFAERARRLKEARSRLRDAESEAGRAAALAADVTAAGEHLAGLEGELAAEVIALERVERTLAAVRALRDLRDLEAAPVAGETVPDPVATERLRQAVAALPAAADARARAAAAGREEGEAQAASARARARLGLIGSVPDLADEAELRGAARTAREAADGVVRASAEHADARTGVPADPVPATTASTPRSAAGFVPGLVLAALGAVAVLAGLLTGLTVAWVAGMVAGIAGAFLVGRGRGGGATTSADAVTDDAVQARARAEVERRAAILAAREEEARVAHAAWEDRLDALGVAQRLDPEQIDEVLATLAEIRRTEAEVERAAAVRAEEGDRVGASLGAIREALIGLAGDAPADDLLESAALAALAAAEASAERAAQAADEARAVDERRNDLERVLAAAIADDPDRRREADTADPAALDAQREVLEARVSRLRQEELPAAHVAIGETRAALRHLEQSADVATAALDVAEAEAELREVADEWLTVELARRVVNDAHARFVEERQPAVIARAAERVREATGGAWHDLRMQDGGDGGARSMIIAADGHRMPFSELSQGAVGLVYLCLRIGLVEELSATTGVALPVIMDDVLTHLDPEREAGAARVIADLAQRHQVIYLTCHASQVEALRRAQPGLHEIVLDRLV